MSIIVRRGVIIAAAFCVLSASRLSGQFDPDRLLNRTYQDVLRKMTPDGQEQLRKAERAWLAFLGLNKAAIREAAPRLGLSASSAQEFERQEVGARINQLEDLGSSQGPELTAVFRQNDKQLNIVYQRCINSMSPAEVEALRKAQRAWLVFREESRKFGGLVGARITAARTRHLNAFYIHSASTRPPQTVEQYTPQKADGTTPDPFERAR
jgi:uncharacterized protein YecT (DUF1311 family)